MLSGLLAFPPWGDDAISRCLKLVFSALRVSTQASTKNTDDEEEGWVVERQVGRTGGKGGGRFRGAEGGVSG